MLKIFGIIVSYILEINVYALMNQLFLRKMSKFYEKIPKFVKRLTITLLTMQINGIFITEERMFPITRH